MESAEMILSVDRQSVTVAPGAGAEMAVTIRNLTTLLDEATLKVKGIDPSWVQVIPERVPVFAQGQTEARVIVRPSANAREALAGAYAMRIVATSQESPGQEVEAQVTLNVSLTGDYRIAMAEDALADNQGARRRIVVTNDANAPLRIRLSGSDPDTALWYKFDAFQLEVPAGEKKITHLTVQGRQSGVIQRSLLMYVESQGEYLLLGGTQTPAQSRQVAGQFTSARQNLVSISVYPPVATGATQGAFQIYVENRGAQTIVMRLTADADADDARLQFLFDPERLLIGPQSRAQAQLVVRASTRDPQRGSRAHTFHVLARPADGTQVSGGTASAQFVQQVLGKRSRPSPWPIVAVILLALVALLMIALYLSNNLPL